MKVRGEMHTATDTDKNQIAEREGGQVARRGLYAAMEIYDYGVVITLGVRK